MPEKVRGILGAVVTWHERSQDRLSTVRVEVDLVGPTVGRSKNSITVEIVAPDRLVGVTIWDSGEYEEITTLVEDDADPSVSVGELVDAGAAVVLLERVVADIIDRPEI